MQNTEAQEIQETCTLDPYCKAHPDTDCPDPEDWTLQMIDQWATESDD